MCWAIMRSWRVGSGKTTGCWGKSCFGLVSWRCIHQPARAPINITKKPAINSHMAACKSVDIRRSSIFDYKPQSVAFIGIGGKQHFVVIQHTFKPFRLCADKHNSIG